MKLVGLTYGAERRHPLKGPVGQRHFIGGSVKNNLKATDQSGTFKSFEKVEVPLKK